MRYYWYALLDLHMHKADKLLSYYQGSTKSVDIGLISMWKHNKYMQYEFNKSVAVFRAECMSIREMIGQRTIF